MIRPPAPLHGLIAVVLIASIATATELSYVQAIVAFVVGYASALLATAMTHRAIRSIS